VVRAEKEDLQEVARADRFKFSIYAMIISVYSTTTELAMNLIEVVMTGGGGLAGNSKRELLG